MIKRNALCKDVLDGFLALPAAAIANDRLVLDIWQGISLWKHRQHGHTRELVVHLIGN